MDREPLGDVDMGTYTSVKHGDQDRAELAPRVERWTGGTRSIRPCLRLADHSSHFFRDRDHKLLRLARHVRTAPRRFPAAGNPNPWPPSCGRATSGPAAQSQVRSGLTHPSRRSASSRHQRQRGGQPTSPASPTVPSGGGVRRSRGTILRAMTLTALQQHQHLGDPTTTLQNHPATSSDELGTRWWS